MTRVCGALGLAAIVLVATGPLMGQAASQPTGGTSPSFISLAELQQHYADKIKKLRQAIEGERLASLEAFLKKAPASEREPTLLAMIEAAAMLERSDQVLRLSDEYLKGSPSIPDAWTVRQTRYAALVAGNRVDEALAEWEKATSKVDMDAWQQTFDAGIQIADALIEGGRSNDAAKLYKALRSKYSFVSNLGQVLDPREAALKWIGKTPPALEGKDLEGNSVDLSQYKGKVVLIDFWATWCQPCVATLPELIETYKTYRSAGFEIVGISVDQDKEALTRFLKMQPIPWRIVLDGKGPTDSNARKYEVSAIPATFLVDRSGRIAAAGTPTRGYGPVVKRLVQQSSQKKP
jgi:peroxiredoxin